MSHISKRMYLLTTNKLKANFDLIYFRPISKSAQNWFGLGLTIVDSLDTMLIMGLQVTILNSVVNQ